MESKELNEKLLNYQARYANYLHAKYFSDKDIYGGTVFEERTINGMTFRISRESGMKSYVDPLTYWNEKYAHIESPTETLANLANGKHSSKKSA